MFQHRSAQRSDLSNAEQEFRIAARRAADPSEELAMAHHSLAKAQQEHRRFVTSPAEAMRLTNLSRASYTRAYEVGAHLGCRPPHFDLDHYGNGPTAV
jgi:hypothetical protein